MHSKSFAFIASVAFIATARPALAGFPTERFTSYAEIRIKSPLVEGTLWIDGAGLEAIQQFDRDGDFEYSADEMNAVRFFLGMYLQRNFLVMWDQEIQPLRINTVEVSRRSGSERPFFRVEFRITDLPPRRPLALASRMLSELTPESRTYAKIQFDGAEELYVLGPTRFFSTDRTERAIPADSTFRPDAQRGRIASLGDSSVEMLYEKPAGAFHLYMLSNDQYTAQGIAGDSLDVSIQPGKEGPYRSVKLAANPLPGDKSGMASRFSLADPQFTGYSTFNADIRIGAGAAMKRIIFEFPAVVIPPRTAGRAELTRRGCVHLCPGVDLKLPAPDKCPRCGGRMIALDGDSVPGLHMVGPHGGALIAYGGAGERFEGLITPEKEFRLYLTNEKLESEPLKKLTGSAQFSADERFQGSVIEIQATKSADGRYLAAAMPPTVSLPIHVRWTFNFNEGEGASHVDFMFDETVSVPQAASQPAATQPASTQAIVPATATQPAR